MRTVNSIKNSFISICSFLVIFICNLFVRKYLIIYMGTNYLGINGLFTNILSILSIAELGIGSSIIYHLYEPLVRNDYYRIAVLLKFYKKCYNAIACFIFIAGLFILPFIHMIVREIDISDSIYLLFFLSLLDVVSTYLLSYKRSIFTADQKNYLVSIIHMLQIIMVSLFKIIILKYLKSYISFVLISILLNILENLIISIYANHRYPFIKMKTKKIDANLKKDIILKVKGTLFHRIGSTLIQSTDNILISNFIGLSIVGIYSNYSSIIMAIQSMIVTIFNSLVSSVGNMLVSENNEKVNSIFNNLFFINNMLYVVFCSLLLVCIQPFITLWIGNIYLLSDLTLILIVLVFFFQGLRRVMDMFTTAAGIFYENKHIPVIECLTNLLFSILLIKKYGFNGVFIGTIISQIITYLIGYNKYLNLLVLKKSNLSYYSGLINYLFFDLLIIFISCICTIYLTKCIISSFWLLFFRFVICLIISCSLELIFFRKRREFKYILNLLVNLKK